MNRRIGAFKVVSVFVLVSYALSMPGGVPAHAMQTSPEATPPAGLSAEDWRQIQNLLPSALTSQQAYLKASNTGAGDYFGYKVALSGNTLVVGARNEASNATGVDGDQSDNSAPNAGAAYIFVRSGMTWSQQAYLKASNTETGDSFSYSVAIDGDTVVVGAPFEDSNAIGANGDQNNNSMSNSGAAYVFIRNGTSWNQQAYLKASNTGASDNFGISVAISGDTVVVGATQEDSNATGVNGNQSDNSASQSGAAYVFRRSGTSWSQQSYLKASNTGGDDYFGWPVAIDGDTVVVGARYEASNATGVDGDQSNNSAPDAGAAYIFVRSGMTWSQQAYLKASNTETNDNFGFSVAIDGDTVVVGAPFEDSNAIGANGDQNNNSMSSSGAAYVFIRSGTSWSQQTYLKASNTGASDVFGISVAIDGDTVVIGAYSESSNATGVNGNQNDNSATFSGAAYVFRHSGTTWSQVLYLKASNTEAFDGFGYSVAVSGGTVVVGAHYEDSNTSGVNGNQNDNSASDSGAVYILIRNDITRQQAYMKASNTETMDYFGYSVAISGDTVVVGAYGEDSSATGNQGDNSALYAGAVYVFDRSGTTWSQQAYLKASNSGQGDVFGSSVAISGDTLVVGANGEDSNATGVDGNQTDNSASGAGAAYVFVRNGTTWSQQAYLKASNTGVYDYFGLSVAISGDTVMVGAYGEDSNASGVGGNQGDNSVNNAGAAYVFTRSGTSWSQQAYMKASNTGANDWFGYSVAIDGDTVLIGAYGEGSNATGVNGNQSDNSATQSGAAYVFTRSGTSWNQEAYLKASNTGTGDKFGYPVAISGDTVVAGASGEDSSATGVDGNQSDNSAFYAGAAYVFTRSGTSWSQQAYLKASNTGADDEFGYSVAISGDTVAVGAPGEDSNATGANGDQGNNTATQAGAAYVFVGSGGSWSQQGYLKASNTETNDSFARSVALSGDTVVVGAPDEDSSATGVNGDQWDHSAVDSGAAYVFVPDYAPSDINLSNSTVEENQPVGTVVGTFTTDDPDSGDTHTYSFACKDPGPDNVSFQINGSSLQTNEVFDRETKNSYAICIRTDDGNGGTFDKDFIIHVADVNETPSDITLSNSSVAENQPTGSVVGTLTTTDPDFGGTHNYSFACSTPGVDDAYFQISNDSLQTDAVFDFETKNTYAICVRTEDNQGATFDKNISINVTDVNEAPSDITLSNSSVAENQPVGTEVGTLTTTDPDFGDTHFYSFACSTPGVDDPYFQISDDSLQTNVDFDHETKYIYEICVRTEDGRGGTLDKNFDIKVIDLNERPTDINLSNSSVGENQPVGAVVGTLTTTDPDSGDPHTYAFTCSTPGVDDASFQVSGDSLQTNAVFDFETKDTYAICIRTEDNHGATSDKNFTISVTNANETPSDIALSNSSVAENQPTGTVVGTLTTTDQDAVDTHTYSFACSTPGADDASFQITGNSLQTHAIYNYETKNAYAICIRVEDNHGGNFDKNFTINVTDTNDPPTGISLSNSSVTENQPIGTTIGTLTTTDQDSGDTHTYAFACSTPSADDVYFQITGNSLQTNAIFNYETTNAYFVCIRTEDTQGATFDKYFTIRITKAIETLTATFRSVGVNDGWILESAEASNVGGTMNAAATTFNLGDEAGDKQYRAVLSFNTASLPDTAVVTKVTLKIKRPATGYLVGNNSPFSWGMSLKVDVCRNFFGTTVALQLGDFNFNNATNCKLLAGTFGGTPVAYWYSANILSTAFARINKTGTTQFRLRFAKDDNDDGAADYMKFYSGNFATTTARPMLVIEYYVP